MIFMCTERADIKDQAATFVIIRLLSIWEWINLLLRRMTMMSLMRLKICADIVEIFFPC